MIVGQAGGSCLYLHTYCTCLGLKAEWARSRARANRWVEEQELVQEEMRRVLMFLKSRAAWWETQGARDHESATPDLLDGLSSYAKKQAVILRNLRQRFAFMWRPRLIAFQLTADWFEDASLDAPIIIAPVVDSPQALLINDVD